MNQPTTATTRGQPLVSAWLILVCVLVYAMILLGGATRLTDSGLSITEWKPISGVLPPMNAHDWAELFGRYQHTTEYQEQNRGMSLADFQTLYWWEWGHRLLGRVIGLVVAAGIVMFWTSAWMKRRRAPALALLGLVGIEGVIGWWMVTSGLFSALDVSPVRLAIHLAMAFVIIALALWLALDALGWPRAPSSLGGPKWLTPLFVALVFAQVIFGALLAGADNGPAFPDWPTIGGRWIPSDAFALDPFFRNFVANPATQHLFHRTLGYAVAAVALILAAFGARSGQGSARNVALALGAIGLAQACLGVTVLLTGAPLGLSLLHQAGAAALWLCAISLMRARR